jgi:hypothetical protein
MDLYFAKCLFLNIIMGEILSGGSFLNEYLVILNWRKVYIIMPPKPSGVGKYLCLVDSKGR